jgi:hypothetical protein
MTIHELDDLLASLGWARKYPDSDPGGENEDTWAIHQVRGDAIQGDDFDNVMFLAGLEAQGSRQRYAYVKGVPL